MTDLVTLHRLYALTNAPDRETDVALLTTLMGYRDLDGGHYFDRGNEGYFTLEGDERNYPLPSPTTDRNDSFAFRKHLLPGSIVVYSEQRNETWKVRLVFDLGTPAHFDVTAASPALAEVRVTLLALIAQAEG